MSNEKEKREEYQHKMRAKILNNDSIDGNIKDILMDLFDMSHNATVNIKDLLPRVENLEESLLDPDAHEMK